MARRSRAARSALRERAYAFAYQDSVEPTNALDACIHHYTWHRPHQGIGGATACLDSDRQG